MPRKTYFAEPIMNLDERIKMANSGHRRMLPVIKGKYVFAFARCIGAYTYVGTLKEFSTTINGEIVFDVEQFYDFIKDKYKDAYYVYYPMGKKSGHLFDVFKTYVVATPKEKCFRKSYFEFSMVDMPDEW